MTSTELDPADTDDDGDAPRSHRLRWIVLGVVAVLLLAGATWVVAFSSLFGVRTVVVSGEHRITAAQVLAAADVTDGTPLLRLDTDAVRARVERLPDVASAQVTTSFPTTVRIAITEREPVGVVAAAGGFELVDRTGLQFEHVTARPGRLPLLVVPRGSDARTVGGAVATVADALPPALLHRIASIQAMDPQAITILIRSGQVVRWGGPDESATKARLLAVLLRRPGEIYDVSDPSQPYIRSS